MDLVSERRYDGNQRRDKRSIAISPIYKAVFGNNPRAISLLVQAGGSVRLFTTFTR
jgi:hypothetical protein